MNIKRIDGGRTLPNEDSDCWVRSMATVLKLSYGKVWKLACSKYNRKIGKGVKFRSKGEPCGAGSDFVEFGKLFRWTPLPSGPTVDELDLESGRYLIDICNQRTAGMSGHHMVAAVDGVVFDNDEAVGLETGVCVGFWKLEGNAAPEAITASALVREDLVEHPNCKHAN